MLPLKVFLIWPKSIFLSILNQIRWRPMQAYFRSSMNHTVVKNPKPTWKGKDEACVCPYHSRPPGGNKDVLLKLIEVSLRPWKRHRFPGGDESSSHCDLSGKPALPRLFTLIYWFIDWTVLITWILPDKLAAVVHILATKEVIQSEMAYSVEN